MIIANREFTIDSSRERIWECVVKALMRCMPFEGIQFADERTFSALLRVRIGSIALPMRVTIEIVDIEKLETIAANIKATGIWGLVWFNQKATFTLTTVEENNTEVTATIVAEGMAFLLRTLLLWKVKSFANDSLHSVERFLREWT